MRATSCPSKPWDSIRVCPPVVKTKIGPGKWYTSVHHCEVDVKSISSSTLGLALFGRDVGACSAMTWREIGEFIIEACNQMEGKG